MRPPATTPLTTRLARQLAFFRPNTLSGRLVLLSSIALFLAVLLIFALMMYQQQRLLRAQWADSLSAQAVLIASNSEAAVAFMDAKEATRLLAALAQHSLVLDARIVMRETGRVFASYQRAGAGQVSQGADRQAREGAGQQFFDDHVVVWTAVEEDGQPVARLELTASLAHIDEIFRKAMVESMWVLLAVFSALLVFSSRMMARLLAPVRELRNLLRRLTANPSLLERAEPKGGREIAALARGLNRLIDTVQARDAELAEYRDNLEQLVEQRMHALELATAEARRANQAKSSFLARMSHEIRTPMNAIVGLGRLLRRSPLNRQQRDQLDKIIASSDALLGIIDDVLDYSRIEAGKLSLEAIPFDVLTLCRRALGVVTLSAEEKGLELLLHLEAGVPARVVGDPLRIGQVLINLLGNAVKFTSDGEVVLRVSCSPAGGAGERVTLGFSVIDSGIGIAPEHLDSLFQPFSQGDDSVTRRFGGTGLGLSICAQLVRLMDGKIEVDSQPGRGSTFHVEFTLPLAPAESGMLPDSALTGLQGQRVLVIDDSTGARAALTAMLTRLGLQVEACADGHSGLDRLAAAVRDNVPFDKVLIDWRMAGIDGLQTARRIQMQPNVLGAPAVILLVSNSGYETIAPRMNEAGIAAVLVKPVLPDALQDALLEATAARSRPTEDMLQPNRWVDEAATAWQAIRGAHVLLVDDLPLNREVAREFLLSAGLRVSEAGNGEEALAQLEEHDDIALVLMDIQMPVLDGLAATRQIRRDPRYRQLPIVAMTAHAMEGDREQSLVAGMNDHLTKPIDPETLFAALLQWIPPGDYSGVPLALEEVSNLSDAGGAALPPLPGIDCERGLSNHMGRVALYRRILLGFRTQFADAVTQLRALIADNAWTDARRLAHSCKSAAATIGAAALAEVARRVENCLAREQPVAADELDAFAQALAQVLTALQSVDAPAAGGIATAAAAPAVAGDAPVPARVFELIAQMTELLQRHDAGVERALESLSRLLPDPAYAADLQAMREWIEEVEYEMVPPLLERLRSRLLSQHKELA